jgi:predicted GH43/DUF377 family glycosyl hydrolase
LADARPPVPVSREPHRLRADPRRVVANLFVPGHEMLAGGESRAATVVDRVLAMTDDEVAETLHDVLDGFRHRHRHLDDVLDRNFAAVAHRLARGVAPSPTRRRLLGAYFTQEYAVEAAALFNPSIVEHPCQDGLAPHELRFVMSLRAVGEGHRSSIEFRTGVVSGDGTVQVDDPGPYVVTGTPVDSVYDRDFFELVLHEHAERDEDTAFIVDSLPPWFTRAELDGVLSLLRAQRATRHSATDTSHRVELFASSNYEVVFSADTAIAERVLWPHGPPESAGMEDARFVRFVDDDGSARYYATYTAFDGSHVAPQLIETSDFATFRVSQLAGPAAKNKGMALFPRKVGGRYVALSRSDRENIGLATSEDGRSWGEASVIDHPIQPWELIQLGNCGSPIETPEGWLVLTHGVGPMRVYSMGALLLDLDDPRRVIGRLTRPWLTPTGSERDGYVPNVVYSCGALVHEGSLVVPYGSSDAAVGIACVPLAALLDALDEA